MEKPWGPRLVEVVAGEVRRHRTRRGMSTQALADACAALGWPIKRTVLSNLESGYRETITVPELFVIAQALEVAPLQLLLPLGNADSVEIRPGVEVSTVDALLWLAGERPLPDSLWEGNRESPFAVASFRMHQQHVDRWTRLRMSERRYRDEGKDREAVQIEGDAEQAAEGLLNLRKVMRAAGITPPPLPAAMAHLEEVSES